MASRKAVVAWLATLLVVALVGLVAWLVVNYLQVSDHLRCVLDEISALKTIKGGNIGAEVQQALRTLPAAVVDQASTLLRWGIAIIIAPAGIILLLQLSVIITTAFQLTRGPSRGPSRPCVKCLLCLLVVFCIVSAVLYAILGVLGIASRLPLVAEGAASADAFCSTELPVVQAELDSARAALRALEGFQSKELDDARREADNAELAIRHLRTLCGCFGVAYASLSRFLIPGFAATAVVLLLLLLNCCSCCWLGCCCIPKDEGRGKEPAYYGSGPAYSADAVMVDWDTVHSL